MKTKRLRQTFNTDLYNLHASQRYGIPLLSIICRHTHAVLRTACVSPSNYTAPYRTARGLWAPGPAHGPTESRGGRLSIPTHKLYSPFPDMCDVTSVTQRLQQIKTNSQLAGQLYKQDDIDVL